MHKTWIRMFIAVFWDATHSDNISNFPSLSDDPCGPSEQAQAGS